MPIVFNEMEQICHTFRTKVFTVFSTKRICPLLKQ